jgi:hypothetical protein
MTMLTDNRLHWNYFLALEQDMERTARYIELCHANRDVFSIELAHLLFAAASEVDVLAKCICKRIMPNAPCGNIKDYRRIFTGAAKLPANDVGYIPSLAKLDVYLPRYGMKLSPWAKWAKGAENPDWWTSYNNVKHERNRFFQEATLQNALDALAGLLVMNYYYHFLLLIQPIPGPSNRFPPVRLWGSDNAMRVTNHLTPQSVLFRLPEYYYDSPGRQLAEFAKGLD